ncbi:MAG: hypothetical protein EPN17_13000 [Methylobacter sp.]|nr:MAG: hypothetical protein EPN17_13000 [Methylobacter sp.]
MKINKPVTEVKHLFCDSDFGVSNIFTEDELRDQVAIFLGERLADEIVLGRLSSGTRNDLEKTGEIAKNNDCKPSISKKWGN